MLLPPDVRDWVADNELAHFILEAVESTPLATAQVNLRGTLVKACKNRHPSCRS